MSPVYHHINILKFNNSEITTDLDSVNEYMNKANYQIEKLTKDSAVNFHHLTDFNSMLFLYIGVPSALALIFLLFYCHCKAQEYSFKMPTYFFLKKNNAIRPTDNIEMRDVKTKIDFSSNTNVDNA